jgi:hypothetical protein
MSSSASPSEISGRHHERASQPRFFCHHPANPDIPLSRFPGPIADQQTHLLARIAAALEGAEVLQADPETDVEAIKVLKHRSAGRNTAAGFHGHSDVLTLSSVLVDHR